MKPDLQVYSDFIKRNKVVVGISKYDDANFAFYYEGALKVIPLIFDPNCKLWFAANDDGCKSKKASVYYHLKNNYPNLK